MKSFKSYLLKEDIKDILLSDYKNKEMLLDEILDEYLFLINDIRNLPCHLLHIVANLPCSYYQQEY